MELTSAELISKLQQKLFDVYYRHVRYNSEKAEFIIKLSHEYEEAINKLYTNPVSPCKGCFAKMTGMNGETSYLVYEDRDIDNIEIFMKIE
jgi:hypothetical protein